MPASKKKASGTKGGVKSGPSVSLEGGIPKLRLDFPLDEKKVAAIQRCIAKGKLTVTVSRVDLAGGRLGEAWLYD
jgi:anti-sigma28 factor (negative regulator of flagellin synthesis)